MMIQHLSTLPWRWLGSSRGADATRCVGERWNVRRGQPNKVPRYLI